MFLRDRVKGLCGVWVGSGLISRLDCNLIAASPANNQPFPHHRRQSGYLAELAGQAWTGISYTFLNFILY